MDFSCEIPDIREHPLRHIRSYVYVSEEARNDIMSDKKLFPEETEFTPGSNAVTCLYSFPNYPDGLVRTSIRELSCYLIAIMNKGVYNGSRILQESTIEKMLTLQFDAFRSYTWLQRPGKSSVRGLPKSSWT